MTARITAKINGMPDIDMACNEADVRFLIALPRQHNALVDRHAQLRADVAIVRSVLASEIAALERRLKELRGVLRKLEAMEQREAPCVRS